MKKFSLELQSRSLIHEIMQNQLTKFLLTNSFVSIEIFFMKIKDGIKSELEQYDKETNDQFRQILAKQYQEMDKFKRNYIYNYGEILKTTLSDSSIQLIRDTDERSHLLYQKSQIEYFYHSNLSKIKKKHQSEINQFSNARLKGRMNIISSYHNLESLSLTPSITTPKSFSQTLIQKQSNPNSSSARETPKKTKLSTATPKNYHKKGESHSTPSHKQSSLKTSNSSQINSSLQLNTSNVSNLSTPDQSSDRHSSSFLSWRSTCNSSRIVKTKAKPKKKIESNEEINFLDAQSLKKHFEKSDKVRQKMEEDRKHRFEEQFSYIIEDDEVTNYSQMNLIDQNQIDEFQNKGQFEDPKLNAKTLIVKIDDNKEEALIAPINKLDDQEILVSEDSYYSSSEGIPTNNVTMDSSYESYYSEYEIEEKIYVSVQDMQRDES